MSDKFVVGKLYRFVRDWERRTGFLCDFGERGEVVEYNGRTLGCLHFTSIRRNKEVTLPVGEVVGCLEEVE